MPGKEQSARKSGRYDPSELSTCFFPDLDECTRRFIKQKSPVLENVLEVAFRSGFSRANGYESLKVGAEASPECLAKKKTLDDYRSRLFREIRSLGKGSDLDSHIRIIDSRVSRERVEFVYLLDLRSERDGSYYGLYSDAQTGEVQALKNKSVVLTGARYLIGESGEFELQYFPYLSYEAFSYCTKRLGVSKTLERDQEDGALLSNPLIPSLKLALVRGLRSVGHSNETSLVLREIAMRSNYQRSPFTLRSKDIGTANLAFSGSRVEASIEVSLDPVTRQIRSKLLAQPNVIDPE
jgi:hypothetical protein